MLRIVNILCMNRCLFTASKSQWTSKNVLPDGPPILTGFRQSWSCGRVIWRHLHPIHSFPTEKGGGDNRVVPFEYYYSISTSFVRTVNRATSRRLWYIFYTNKNSPFALNFDHHHDVSM
jgi:hypothetical protein